jgi:uncharacterized protein (DUF302 family)
MNSYFTTVIKGNFDTILEKIITELKKEGFGVLTSIDIQQIFKNKLDVNFKKHTF